MIGHFISRNAELLIQEKAASSINLQHNRLIEQQGTAGHLYNILFCWQEALEKYCWVPDNQQVENDKDENTETSEKGEKIWKNSNLNPGVKECA